MVCAILANMMDPSVTFIQTLIELVCYAQGLRDKGMKSLNTLGVTGKWKRRKRKTETES